MDITILSTFLQQLLRSNHKATIPGFGCFKIEEIPSSMLDDGKTLMPPYKRIVFRNADISNDGELEELFSKSSGQSIDDCRKEIGDIVLEMKKELMSASKVDIPCFGTLSFGEGYVFSFHPCDNLNVSGFNVGLDPIIIKEDNAIVNEPAKEGVLDVQNDSPVDENSECNVVIPDFVDSSLNVANAIVSAISTEPQSEQQITVEPQQEQQVAEEQQVGIESSRGRQTVAEQPISSVEPQQEQQVAEEQHVEIESLQNQQTAAEQPISSVEPQQEQQVTEEQHAEIESSQNQQTAAEQPISSVEPQQEQQVAEEQHVEIESSQNQQTAAEQPISSVEPQQEQATVTEQPAETDADTKQASENDNSDSFVLMTDEPILNISSGNVSDNQDISNDDNQSVSEESSGQQDLMDEAFESASNCSGTHGTDDVEEEDHLSNDEVECVDEKSEQEGADDANSNDEDSNDENSNDEDKSNIEMSDNPQNLPSKDSQDSPLQQSKSKQESEQLYSVEKKYSKLQMFFLILLAIVIVFIVFVLLVYIFQDALRPTLEKIFYSKEELEFLNSLGL